MVQELEAFLRTVNLYYRFLPAAANLLQPLTDALYGNARSKDQITWTEHMDGLAFLCLPFAQLCRHGSPHPGARMAQLIQGSPCPDIQCQFLQAAINILEKIWEQRLFKGHYPTWEWYVRDCTFDADRFLNLL
jgi:hypothetical protein